MPQDRYPSAPTFAEFLATAETNQDLWRAVSARALVPDDLLARVAALPGQWRLLVLNEDWCGDAVNTVPVIARLADAAANLELRVLARDANPDLMDAHLTNGTRSIPVVMALDEDFTEHGWWGPRPGPLQEWFLTAARELPKETRYPQMRQWYARDRGQTTLEEVVALLERAAGVAAGARRSGGSTASGGSAAME